MRYELFLQIIMMTALLVYASFTCSKPNEGSTSLRSGQIISLGSLG
jgi:hypothetical protein